MDREREQPVACGDDRSVGLFDAFDAAAPPPPELNRIGALIEPFDYEAAAGH